MCDMKPNFDCQKHACYIKAFFDSGTFS